MELKYSNMSMRTSRLMSKRSLFFGHTVSSVGPVIFSKNSAITLLWCICFELSVFISFDKLLIFVIR